ncbi:MAG: GntR family transcriptional regulator [Actinobacteria bacterium]|nr:GntR family transcriptional regulator [Actinomycetota bacterium]
MIRSGVLAPGMRLPAIRHLANDLGLAVNTVARAYRGLEDDGLVTADGRRGTSVLDLAERPAADPADLGDAADRLAIEAHHRGIGFDAALDQLRAAFGRIALEDG